VKNNLRNLLPTNLLPTITEHKQRAVLAVSGLALIGGLTGSATAAAVGTTPHDTTAPVVSAQTVAANQQANTGKPAQPATGKPAQPATPNTDQLLPNGVPADQQSIDMTPERLDNAKQIVEAGKQMNMPPRAWVIAVATSMQEAKLENLGHLGDSNDHDSLGLFQQRPSSGWGTAEQITNPNHSAKSFYQGLKDVPGYQTKPLSDAAQTVQVSAYPDAYAKWEKQAADTVQATQKH
jgi:hypothetical protein